MHHWEVLNDSSISADSGHERVGMMGGGTRSHVPVNGTLSHWRCLLSYTTVGISLLHAGGALVYIATLYILVLMLHQALLCK